MERSLYDKLFGQYKNAAILYEPLMEAMKEFGINTPYRIAMFFATLEHESGFKLVRENMYFDAKRLSEVWPARFSEGGKPNDMARLLEGKPQEIANVVYSNRMGNGNYKSGDGFKFRGGGPFGTTGRYMFDLTGKALGVDLVSNPDLILEPKTWARSAGYYVLYKKLNAVADANNFIRYQAWVNVGRDAEPSKIVDFDKRLAKFQRICKIMGIA
jgi:putative chitinase